MNRFAIFDENDRKWKRTQIDLTQRSGEQNEDPATVIKKAFTKYVRLQTWQMIAAWDEE